MKTFLITPLSFYASLSAYPYKPYIARNYSHWDTSSSLIAWVFIHLSFRGCKGVFRGGPRGPSPTNGSAKNWGQKEIFAVKPGPDRCSSPLTSSSLPSPLPSPLHSPSLPIPLEVGPLHPARVLQER